MRSMADFVNFKIKPTQSFKSAQRGRVCVHVFIGVSARMCMSICVCTVFLKKILLYLEGNAAAFSALKVADLCFLLAFYIYFSRIAVGKIEIVCITKLWMSNHLVSNDCWVGGVLLC
jgi:hypothetical protein